MNKTAEIFITRLGQAIKEKGVAIGFRKAIKIVKGGEIDGN